METFGEKLRYLRQDNNLVQTELANNLDVKQSIISLWEQGKCEPTLSKLILIAKFFNVSIDYLAGLED